MEKVIKEVEGLFKIVGLREFRKTEGVRFDIVPNEVFDNLSGIDRVIHKSSAVSPGSIEGVERPWYMHMGQYDNLIVLHGERHVDLYNVKHGQIENFIVRSDEIYHNGKLVTKEPAMLIWPPGVFHRVESKEEGSASLNFAVRTNSFDIDDNFSIYEVDTNKGEFKVIREGFKDQI